MFSISAFVVEDIKAHHDRDVNAANNHLAAGLAVLVCGATVRPEESKSRKAGALKQKPRS